MLTELPTGLDESQVRVLSEERNGAPEEVGFRLEVGIKDDHVVTLFDIAVFHAFFESPGLVSISVVSDLVSDINAFARPPPTLHLHQILCPRMSNSQQQGKLISSFNHLIIRTINIQSKLQCQYWLKSKKRRAACSQWAVPKQFTETKRKGILILFNILHQRIKVHLRAILGYLDGRVCGVIKHLDYNAIRRPW